MTLPAHIKRPAEIARLISEHEARLQEPGHVVTQRDVQELIYINREYDKYLAWCEQNGAPNE
jgi:hypothetical protein